MVEFSIGSVKPLTPGNIILMGEFSQHIFFRTPSKTCFFLFAQNLTQFLPRQTHSNILSYFLSFYKYLSFRRVCVLGVYPLPSEYLLDNNVCLPHIGFCSHPWATRISLNLLHYLSIGYTLFVLSLAMWLGLVFLFFNVLRWTLFLMTTISSSAASTSSALAIHINWSLLLTI